MKVYLTSLFIAITLILNAQFQSMDGPLASSVCRGIYSNESMSLVSMGSNLWRSTDNGENWDLITEGIGQFSDPICFAETDGVIVKGTNNLDRVYKSTDNGITWQTANSGMPMISGFPAAVPTSAVQLNGVFYMSGTNFIRRSTDLGLTWETMDIDGLCYGLGVVGDAVWASPGNNVFKSTDDGVTWEQQTTPSLLGVPAQPYEYAQIDNRILASSGLSAGNGLWYSDDQGITWTNSPDISIGDGLKVANGVAYVNAYDGLYRSFDNGETWEWMTNSFIGKDISITNDLIWTANSSGAFIYDITTDEVTDITLPISSATNILTNGEFLFTLSDGSLYGTPSDTPNWQDFTVNITGEEGLVTQYYLDGDELYVWFQTDQELGFYVSTNNGESFSPLGPSAQVSIWNAVYSFNPVLIAGIDDLGLPTIQVSMDDGDTWTEATINSDEPLTNVQFESFSQAGSTLFAFGSQGYATSSDNGSTWEFEIFNNQITNMVGWDGKWIRHYLQWGVIGKVEISYDNGVTWDPFYDGLEGFPEVSGPSGVWMIDDVVYSQNNTANTPEAGRIISITETGAQWEFVEELEPLEFNISSLSGDGNNYYISIPQLGVWSAAIGDVPDSIYESELFAIAMGPNPTDGTIQVFESVDSTQPFQIYNLTGKMIAEVNLSNQILDLSFLPPGQYILKYSGMFKPTRIVKL
ncbi:MAG: T9SS type A sorting domain-containing protein [Flavobacteriales bacterium]|nr:T9SS type A sorting domain-containing protein [Flavobacteriales bacterium]